MDQHSAREANLLIGNLPSAPVLELLLGGAEIEVLRDCWLAFAGAEMSADLPAWKATRVRRGQRLVFHMAHAGLWGYIALPGGIAHPRFFGGCGAELRSGLGLVGAPGMILHSNDSDHDRMFEHLAGRWVKPEDRTPMNSASPIRFYPGPQWEQFTESDQKAFVEREWKLSTQSNRVGYRLEGLPLEARIVEAVSEPTLVGTIQVPPGGQPLVLMRDGPTLGGYPKLGIVSDTDLNRLAQQQPGRMLRFELDESDGSEL